MSAPRWIGRHAGERHLRLTLKDDHINFSGLKLLGGTPTIARLVLVAVTRDPNLRTAATPGDALVAN